MNLQEVLINPSQIYAPRFSYAGIIRFRF